MVLRDGSQLNSSWLQFVKEPPVSRPSGARQTTDYTALRGSAYLRLAREVRSDGPVHVSKYIELFYNRNRRHAALGYISPVAYEQQHLQTMTQQAA